MTADNLREAAQMAIGFVEYHSKYWNGVGTHPQEIAEALRAALALPNAEPVALVSVVPNYGAAIAWLPGHIAKHNDKLYSAPQPAPAEREPLTEQRIIELWDNHTVPVFGKIGINPIVFARDIEAAHNIKSAA
jgi:hypothetical protein